MLKDKNLSLEIFHKIKRSNIFSGHNKPLTISNNDKLNKLKKTIFITKATMQTCISLITK